MKARKKRSASEWRAALYKGGIRMLVGCFVLGTAVTMIFVWARDARLNPVSTTGPRVPLPNVDTATLVIGKRAYQRDGYSGCHVLTGTDEDIRDGKDGRDVEQADRTGPDLTHEGRRNASIDWQINNLVHHHRLYLNSEMPDYNDLPPKELKALASFLASRK